MTMALQLPIYMDYHATTPLDPRVLDAMLPYLKNDFGNAASRNHAFGWKAEAAVEAARDHVAKLIGASGKEIVWTSGATEGNNLAIKGVAQYYRSKGRHILVVGDAGDTKELEAKGFVVESLPAGSTVEAIKKAVRHDTQDEDTIVLIDHDGSHAKDLSVWCTERSILFSAGNGQDLGSLAAQATKGKGRHIITAATEHKATLDTVKRLAHEGWDVTVLDVDHEGHCRPEDVEKAIRKGGPRDTILVTVMHANNEVGTVNDIGAIGAICRKNKVLFHTDAVQSVGKVEVDVEKMNVDLLTMSGHKFYGPKGVGALYVRRKPRVRVTAQIDGGGHEKGMRSGTLNVPGIVGMGKAAELAKAEMKQDAERVLALREKLRKKLESELDHVRVNGCLEHRLPGNLNIAFEYVEGESILMAIKDVACSSGSACTSATLEPSYVLRAMGEEEHAHSSIRFGLGKFNTEEEVDYVADHVVKEIKRLRDMSPLYDMVKDGIDLKSVAWTAH